MVRQVEPELMRRVSVRPCRPYELAGVAGHEVAGTGRPGVLGREGVGEMRGRDHDLCWIAECEGMVLGYVRVVRDADGSARVKELHLWSQSEQSDLAAVLLHAVISHCRRHACVRIVLEAEVQPQLAVSIFSAHGFQWHQRRGVLVFYMNLYHEPERQTARREQPTWGGGGVRVWARRPTQRVLTAGTR